MSLSFLYRVNFCGSNVIGVNFTRFSLWLKSILHTTSKIAPDSRFQQNRELIVLDE